jgi:hypothetical protein
VLYVFTCFLLQDTSASVLAVRKALKTYQDGMLRASKATDRAYSSHANISTSSPGRQEEYFKPGTQDDAAHFMRAIITSVRDISCSIYWACAIVQDDDAGRVSLANIRHYLAGLEESAAKAFATVIPSIGWTVHVDCSSDFSTAVVRISSPPPNDIGVAAGSPSMKSITDSLLSAGNIASIRTEHVLSLDPFDRGYLFTGNVDSPTTFTQKAVRTCIKCQRQAVFDVDFTLSLSIEGATAQEATRECILSSSQNYKEIRWKCDDAKCSHVHTRADAAATVMEITRIPTTFIVPLHRIYFVSNIGRRAATESEIRKGDLGLFFTLGKCLSRPGHNSAKI